MSRIPFDPSAGKAGRASLPGRSPTTRFLSMSTAKRFTVSVAAAVGWALSWAQPVFA
jgi:hypothetical protein